MGQIITADELKSMLPIRPGNSSFDAEVERAIAVVENQAQLYCRRQFIAAQCSEIFHVQAGSQIAYDFLNDSNTDGVYLTAVVNPFIISQGPIITSAPVEVFYSLTHQFTEDTKLFDDDFTVLAERNAIYVNRPLLTSRDSIKITYTGGYDEVPADIKAALLKQARHEFNSAQQEDILTLDDKQQAKAVIRARDGLLPEVAMALAPYRRILRGRG